MWCTHCCLRGASQALLQRKLPAKQPEYRVDHNAIDVSKTFGRSGLANPDIRVTCDSAGYRVQAQQCDSFQLDLLWQNSLCKPAAAMKAVMLRIHNFCLQMLHQSQLLKSTWHSEQRVAC